MEGPTPQNATLPDRKVRLATEADLEFVVHLQKVHRIELGFLTRSALANYIRINQCLVVLENGQHAGYLNWNLHYKGLLRISQIAVSEEILRSKVGSTLQRFMQQAAERAKCGVMRAIPRGDIYATTFFHDQGYTPTGTFSQCNQREIPHIEFTKMLYVPAEQAQAKAIQRARFAPKRKGIRAQITPFDIERLARKPELYVVPPEVHHHVDQQLPDPGYLFASA